MSTMKRSIMRPFVLFLVLHVGCCMKIQSEDGSTIIRAGDPVTYTGGVFEFEPYSDWKDGGEALIMENAKLIGEFAAMAKGQGVDILVSAEYGIESLMVHSWSKKDLFSLMQIVPNRTLSLVPCSMETDPPSTKVLRYLSCVARDHQMYLVINLGEASPCSPDANNPFNSTLDDSYQCPHKGYLYYNTQVVFDREGTVIARYRKKNLFLEPQFEAGTQSNEAAIFTTDFGVTFSTQICFDIAFYNPGISNVVKYGIKDVIMSTAWIDMLPYHTAPSVQNAYSRGLGINLLISGYHYPEKAKMGSGIYRGASDHVFNYVFDPESGSKLLVSKVDTVASVDGKLSSFPIQNALKQNEREGISIEKKRLHREHKIYYDDLSNYTRVHLVQGESEEILQAEACHADGLCCKLSYSPTSHLNYSLLAYSGPVIKGWGAYKIYAQVCSVLWCRTDDVNSCTNIDNGLPEGDSFGSFTLTGSFSTSFIFPIIFDRNLVLANNDHYSFSNSSSNYTISTSNSTRNLMTGAMYGRWYEKDP